MGPPRLGSHPILSRTQETSLAPPPHNCLIFSETVKTATKKVGPAATETLHSGHTCKAPAQARNPLRRATGEPGPAPQLHGDPAPTLRLRPLAETAPRSKWREATPVVSAGSVSGLAPTREATPLPARPRPPAQATPLPARPRRVPAPCTWGPLRASAASNPRQSSGPGWCSRKSKRLKMRRSARRSSASEKEPAPRRQREEGWELGGGGGGGEEVGKSWTLAR